MTFKTLEIKLVYILEALRRTVLPALWNHEQAWPFHKPIDTIKIGLPDYFDIVKHPMDLGTIKNAAMDDIQTTCIKMQHSAAVSPQASAAAVAAQAFAVATAQHSIATTTHASDTSAAV
ncbi:hypothetical protein DAPPUDRAFT_247900 [Daphnia pulex]|uniref:Bromo domain-containing protein n=1 Tax=Daphnia pulex TaxID=6669 RepID=E9GT36_DAPPU|nr:hypothetical protein DAPPUDRAFT_247900 [Daphnia pulex]|eukprot:EFX77341.1 hypothetical protein DAPPUDRAFT_247900 [Daphnia pulex]